MIGAIAGDIIGSVHEHAETKTKDFPLFVEASQFTDDTVLSVAVAEGLLARAEAPPTRPVGTDYVSRFHNYFHAYPNAGYGGTFIRWAGLRLQSPYNSWGNGSAMRVAPVAWAMGTLDEVLAEAERSAAVTHNHAEGIRGAQATAAAIFLARQGGDKTAIRDAIMQRFKYNLNYSLDEIRPAYTFDVSCLGTVPPAIISFLESTDYEDAIRNAISLGGDADTLACITGGIAEAFYGGVPDAIRAEALNRLDVRLRTVVERFMKRFG
jgi:ADP-ribosylglycohydrolase